MSCQNLYDVFDLLILLNQMFLIDASIPNLGQSSTDGHSKKALKQEVKGWKQVKKHILKKRT